MKTLVINGSPRKGGDTAALLERVKQGIDGTVVQINVLEADVAPCRDCRYCRTHSGCCISDGMQAVYTAIEECDSVVLVSPVWFGTLSGPLLSLASRVQTYFSAAYFRKEKPFNSPKKGGVILTGGGTGGADAAYKTAKIILRQMGVAGQIPLVASLNTDVLPALQDQQALLAAEQLAMYLRGEGK